MYNLWLLSDTKCPALTCKRQTVNVFQSVVFWPLRIRVFPVCPHEDSERGVFFSGNCVSIKQVTILNYTTLHFAILYHAMLYYTADQVRMIHPSDFVPK